MGPHDAGLSIASITEGQEQSPTGEALQASSSLSQTSLAPHFDSDGDRGRMQQLSAADEGGPSHHAMLHIDEYAALAAVAVVVQEGSVT